MSWPALGHVFVDEALLERALTHSSWTHENGGEHNERLEYLGDSVLGAAATTLLFQRFPEASEGELTRMRATLVDTDNLAALARRLDVGAHLRLGRGEDQSGGRDRDSNLENAVEALLGAIFLDSDFTTVVTLVGEWLGPDLARLRQLGQERRRRIVSPRSALQELTQAHWRLTPRYEELERSGPPHAPTFRAQVRVGDRVMGEGEGGTKKEAFRAAAAQALARVRREVEAP